MQPVSLFFLLITRLHAKPTDYYTIMGFGRKGSDGSPIIYNSLLQGGIVSIYYLGTLIDALFGGWFGDRFGRIKAIACGAAWGIFGACLQGSAQNHVWMICARLINGFGTGILNAIVPVYATETSEHTSRGQFVAIEFTLNIFGVVLAYWIEFGTSKYRNGDTPFTWRFPILFQVIMLVGLFIICWAFPESPRYLTKVGRGDEARYILGRLRGESGDDEGKAEAEYQDICSIVELERDSSKAQSYWKMLFGIGSGKLHTGRRVQLVIWLQIMQEWIGKFNPLHILPTYQLTILRYRRCNHLLSHNLPTRRHLKQPSPMDLRPKHNNLHALNPNLRLHARPHRSPLDPLLGLHRPRHSPLFGRRPLQTRPRIHRLPQNQLRQRRRRNGLPLHLHLRRNLADRPLALSSRDLPARSPRKGQRMGRRRLVHRQRLAHALVPSHVCCDRRVHALHLRGVQYHYDPYGLGAVSGIEPAHARGDEFTVCGG